MDDLRAQPQPTSVADPLEGYRETKIGPLPREWQVVELGEVADFIMGQSPPSETYNSEEVGLPFLQGKAEFREVYPQPVKWCSVPLKVSPEGAILISVRAPVGDVNLAPYECCIGRGLAAINSGDNVDVGYLFYQLGFSKAGFEERSSGSTFKSINRGVLEHFPIPLPPLHEQRTIAQVLRTVQEAKQATEQVIEATRELKRSLMDHLFRYGPVPVEEAEQVLVKQTPYGMVPSRWETMVLGDLAHVQTGVTKGRKLEGGNVVELPYLRVANVQDGYLDLTEIKSIRIKASEVERFRLQDGDVLLTEGGDFDKLGRGFVWRGQVPDCIHQNHVFAVRADRKSLLPEYLAYLAQSRYGKSYFLEVAHRTTNLASINSTKLKAFPVLVPPLSEQHEIVRIMETVDDKLTAEENRKQTFGVLFKALLHNLMTGKVRVHDVEVAEIQEVV